MAGLIFYRTNHGHLGMSCIQFPAPTLFFSWLELRMHQYNDPPPPSIIIKEKLSL